MKLRCAFFALALLILCPVVHASQSPVQIFYDITPLGDKAWRYDYKVQNNSIDPYPARDNDDNIVGWYQGILAVDIYFDALYANPIATPASGWTVKPYLLPDWVPPSFYFEDRDQSHPILKGASLSGFSMSFTYNGSGDPGVQLFRIDNPDGGELTRGFTEPNPVPLPGTLLLLLPGLAALVIRRCITRAD